MTSTRQRALIFCALVATLGVTSCATGVRQRPPDKVPLDSVRPAIALQGTYAGIVTFNLPAFVRACSCRPNLAVRYVHWGMPPDLTVPTMMLASGAVPLVELQPLRVSLSSIAAGREDSWLISWARAIRRLRARVLMSFAPEANGSRYSYGYHHVPAGVFIAAWRHVVTLFARAGAKHVLWVWIMNVESGRNEPLTQLWPGAAWVSAVGIDGYLMGGGAMVQATFGPTIADIRRFTRKPLLITETAASPAAGKARVVRQLIAIVRRYHLAGFVWFDINFTLMPHALASWGNDWRLETDPAALAAFRRAVQYYR